ncbi:hypothetical protein PCL_01448 [Purpureocillium lilacinum]|uniref:Uncharacterized protein n=1 Tax=Purpureocillium lilacinum TaxID=33203 RepID=A0A2U3E3H8_PURLI|nr:hypothetical protein PCL_01448 [Purpureocillium lilacinum]
MGKREREGEEDGTGGGADAGCGGGAVLVAVSARADLLMYPSTRAHDMAWSSGARLELEERPSTGRSALEEEGMWGIEGDGVRASPTSGCKPWWMHGDGQEPGGNKDGLWWFGVLLVEGGGLEGGGRAEVDVAGKAWQGRTLLLDAEPTAAGPAQELALVLQLSTWSSRRPRLAALDWTTGGLPPATNSGNSALYKLAPAHPISSGATPVEAASAGSSPPSTAARGAKKAEYGGRMGTNPGPGRKPWPNDPSTVEARRLSPSPHLAAWPGFAVSWSEVGRARSRPFSTPNFFHLAMRVPVARTHDSFVCSARLRAKLTPPCATCGEHAVGAWRGGRGPQREGQGPRRTNCLEKRQSWLAGVLSPRPARDVLPWHEDRSRGWMAWARMGEMRAGWGQGERVRGSPGFVLARQMPRPWFSLHDLVAGQRIAIVLQQPPAVVNCGAGSTAQRSPRISGPSRMAFWACKPSHGTGVGRAGPVGGIPSLVLIPRTGMYSRYVHGQVTHRPRAVKDFKAQQKENTRGAKN